MEKITPVSIKKNKAVVEIYGEKHEIKNPKHGQVLEFYGQKYQLELELKPAQKPQEKKESK